MSKWTTTTTSELISNSVLEIGDGYRAKNSEFVPNGGLPFVRVRDITTSIDMENLDELPACQIDRYQPKVSQPLDSVITMKGSIGRVMIISSDFPKFVYSPQLSYWRTRNHKIVDPRWLRFWLESPEFEAQANATKGTTDMADYVSLSNQRRMCITLPPLSVQSEIADVLCLFDDLIGNNRRRIEILEEMARLLYREWFVHFRFPGHEDVELVDSDLGPIPAGWKVAQLSEVCSLVMGQSPKSEHYNDIGKGLPFHQGVTDFGSRYPTHTKWTNVDKRVADAGDILFSVRAPVGRINLAPDRLVVGRGLSAIRANDGNQNFLLNQLQDKFAEEDLIGGGTIFNAVTRHDMESILLLDADRFVVSHFEAKVAIFADLIANLWKQNRVLREARDLLLPRLISGELDVSELDLDLAEV